jgi:glyoxylase-like metal-dependent hydrolase (beta-lactamase superfamily II)
MDELAPGLWRWTRRHPEWHSDEGFAAQVASFALRDDAGLVLVDPLLGDTTDPELAEIVARATGQIRILITIPYHVRSAELVRDWLKRAHEVTIYGHERCRRRLASDEAFAAVRGGETIAGGIRAHAIGNPRRMEVPFELPSHRALAFGDAIVETGGGRLRVWKQWDRVGPEWYPTRFLPTLQPLAALDLEAVLVTHGEPVLRDGAAALSAALEAAPWEPSRDGRDAA